MISKLLLEYARNAQPDYGRHLEHVQRRHGMNFEILVETIGRVHRELQTVAVKAVNIPTCRNWLIGVGICFQEISWQKKQ